MNYLYRYVFRTPQDERGFYNWHWLFLRNEHPYLDSYEISHNREYFGKWYERLRGSFNQDITNYRHFFLAKGNKLFWEYDFPELDKKYLAELVRYEKVKEIKLIRYVLKYDIELIPPDHKDKYQCVLPLTAFYQTPKIEKVLWKFTNR